MSRRFMLKPKLNLSHLCTTRAITCALLATLLELPRLCLLKLLALSETERPEASRTGAQATNVRVPVITMKNGKLIDIGSAAKRYK